MPRCNKCGTVFDEEYEFCTECGAKREYRQPPPPKPPTPPTTRPPPPPTPPGPSRPIQTPVPLTPKKKESSNTMIIVVVVIIIVVIAVIVSLAVIGILVGDGENGETNGNGNNNSDTTPPTVVSTDPYNEEMFVSVYTPFKITFSEPMYQSSTIHGALKIEIFDYDTNTTYYYTEGYSSYWVNSKTVSIELDDALDSNSVYVAYLKYPHLYEIKDQNGNYAEYEDDSTYTVHYWIFSSEFS